MSEETSEGERIDFLRANGLFRNTPVLGEETDELVNVGTIAPHGVGGNAAAMLEILRSPHIVPGPSDAGAHLLRASNAGFPTRLLGDWVRERQALTLEQAVHLLSGRAAMELGIRNRGLLQAGHAADVVLFDAETVGALDKEFVADLPGGGERWIQRAEGIEAVIVNGESLIERGEATGRWSGQTLRG